ncbi:hypothetical protein CDD82_6725 [Ophiocordyceps australis]|uniref:ATP phosphoribosyltransferase n=1 Tax=Ophiocordyceps australis TaxID=1399860 RepID=A0A2C5XZ29_9HYPO|nr:hypothetical protein CDD82_6725 [Ophiocordyceps australis]
MASLYSLVFYAPPAAVSACKAAIFAAGAGRFPAPSKYTECCWSSTGTGQFRPGDAAQPHIGSVGILEETPEVRVETICVGTDVARKAVEALKACVSSPSLNYRLAKPHQLTYSAHPYEEPAYHVYKHQDLGL